MPAFPSPSLLGCRGLAGVSAAQGSPPASVQGKRKDWGWVFPFPSSFQRR